MRMGEEPHPDVDWHDWFRRWETQQEGYVPECLVWRVLD
jgi:hypothetical protein